MPGLKSVIAFYCVVREIQILPVIYWTKKTLSYLKAMTFGFVYTHI